MSELENKPQIYKSEEYKREGILFCLVGPTASGKSTIAEKLLSVHTEDLRQSISYTTREIRQNEVDGINYNYIDINTFNRMKSNGEFFETEEIHGNYYGTPLVNIEDCINYAKDLLLVIDIKGALNLKNNFPDNTVICFILPPSFSDIEKRMKARGHVELDEINLRLETAKEEIEKLYQARHIDQSIDYIVRNQDLKSTCKRIHYLLLSERLRFTRVIDEELLK